MLHAPIQLYPGVWQVSGDPETQGFSFLIERPDGNILIPNVVGDNDGYDVLAFLAERGGVVAVFGCCKHNVKRAGNLAGLVCDRFDAPLYVGAPDSKGGTVKSAHLAPLKYVRHAFADDIEIIPLPGYTTGSLGVLWRGPDRIHLFTGVTFTRKNGAWKTWASPSRAPKAIEGLQMMKTLDYNVLYANSFANTENPWFEVTPESKVTMLDEIIAAVRREYLPPAEASE